MPIDIDILRSLSVEEQKKWIRALEEALGDKQKELEQVEKKLKGALMDDSANLSIISPLLTYRDELRNELKQIKSDLEQIIQFGLRGEDKKPNPASVAASTSGAGVVSIRADDTNNREVPGAKTHQQILDERQKEEEAFEIVKLDAQLKKLEEYRKIEKSKKAISNN